MISLQLSFKVASLAYTPIYTRVYQATLDWIPGFVFTLSSIITVLATIPIRLELAQTRSDYIRPDQTRADQAVIVPCVCFSVVGCRLSKRNEYERIQGD